MILLFCCRKQEKHHGYGRKKFSFFIRRVCQLLLIHPHRRHDKDTLLCSAVNQKSQIVGFSSITPQGYLHNMFVHKDFQDKGVATVLLNEIERYAAVMGIKRITSEVSLTARPFFEKRGFVVEKEQKCRANKLFLTNFVMAKELNNK